MRRPYIRLRHWNKREIKSAGNYFSKRCDSTKLNWMWKQCVCHTAVVPAHSAGDIWGIDYQVNQVRGFMLSAFGLAVSLDAKLRQVRPTNGFICFDITWPVSPSQVLININQHTFAFSCLIYKINFLSKDADFAGNVKIRFPTFHRASRWGNCRSILLDFRL